jgi:hypothetical protein
VQNIITKIQNPTQKQPNSTSTSAPNTPIVPKNDVSSEPPSSPPPKKKSVRFFEEVTLIPFIEFEAEAYIEKGYYSENWNNAFMKDDDDDDEESDDVGEIDWGASLQSNPLLDAMEEESSGNQTPQEIGYMEVTEQKVQIATVIEQEMSSIEDEKRKIEEKKRQLEELKNRLLEEKRKLVGTFPQLFLIFFQKKNDLMKKNVRKNWKKPNLKKLNN